MPTETAPLSEIVAQLKAEHRPGYVYRGQIQEWMPLLPSAYRQFALPDKTFAFQGPQRMRGTGEHFILYWVNIEQMLTPEAASIYRLWSGVFAHLRNALGYALSNILAQQAGIQSEGVDVTEDVDVAAFFATHRFDGRYYHRVEDGTGVIYRYAVTEPELTFDALRKWDFYSCPAYLPSHKIMKMFGTVETLRDCFRSVDDYCQQINWGVMFDLDAIRDKRPFEHLRMPRFTQYDSRIAHQSAGLLLPDYILTQDWAEEDFVPDASKMPLEVGKLPAVENLARHPGAERFYFAHQPAQTAESPQTITRYYFPLADISRELLRNWVKRVVHNPFQNRPLPIRPERFSQGELYDYTHSSGIDPVEVLFLESSTALREIAEMRQQGEILTSADRLDDATDRYQQALALATEAGELEKQAFIHLDLAGLNSKQEQPAEHLQHIRAALRQVEEYGDPTFEAMLRCHIAIGLYRTPALDVNDEKLSLMDAAIAQASCSVIEFRDKLGWSLDKYIEIHSGLAGIPGYVDVIWVKTLRCLAMFDPYLRPSHTERWLGELRESRGKARGAGYADLALLFDQIERLLTGQTVPGSLPDLESMYADCWTRIIRTARLMGEPLPQVES